MVQIKIDQASHSAGVAGVAREDLAVGTAVLLTAVGGPYFRYAWRIVSKPFDLDTATRSAALLVSPEAATSLLSPIDVPGTYLIEVSVDSGAGLGAAETDVARITFYAGPVLATVPGRTPLRVPATRETTEHNVASNDEGWAATLRRWFRVITDLFAVRSWAQAVVTDDFLGGVEVLKGINVASVTPVGATYTVVFSTAFPDAAYGVLATPADGQPMVPFVTNQLITGFEIGFFDPSGLVVQPVAQFCFEVILR